MVRATTFEPARNLLTGPGLGTHRPLVVGAPCWLREAFDDSLLATTVGEVRSRLRLVDGAGQYRARDLLLFGGAVTLGFMLANAMFVAFAPLALSSALITRLTRAR